MPKIRKISLFDRKLYISRKLLIYFPYFNFRKRYLNGEYNCSLETAIKLAGLQIQAKYGRYREGKHKPGYLRSIYKLMITSIVSHKLEPDWMKGLTN